MVAAGLLARLFFVLVVPVEPVSDFKRYYDVAANFAQEGALAYRGAPFISQGVTFPLFLGCVFKVAGVGVTQAKVANFLVSAGMLIAFAILARSRDWRPSAVLAAVAVAAFHPGLLTYHAVLGTEMLSLLLVVLSLLAVDSASRRSSIAAGAAYGLFALSRPQFLPVLPVYAAIRSIRGRVSRRHAAIALVAFALVLTPWMVRNRVVFGEWIPVSANSGYGLMVNNNSANRESGWMPLSEIDLPPEARASFARQGAGWFFEPGDEDEKMLRWMPAQDRLARKVGFDWIVTHPSEFARLALLRLHSAFSRPATSMLNWPLRDVGVPFALAVATCALTTGLYVLALIGLVRLRTGVVARPSTILAALTLLAGLFAIVVFEGQGRYALPMLPACLVLVGDAFARIRGCGDTLDVAQVR